MATLRAWKFSTPDGADFALDKLEKLQGQARRRLLGAAVRPDLGISEDFISSVREKVTPGRSALFLLSSDAVIDRVKTEFTGTQAELISTNLDGPGAEAPRGLLGRRLTQIVPDSIEEWS